MDPIFPPAHTNRSCFVISGQDTALFDIIRFTGEEALSQRYCYILELETTQPQIDAATLLDQRAHLQWHTESGLQRIAGIVTAIEQLDATAPASAHRPARYRLTLEPTLSRLHLNRNCRVFVKKSDLDVVREVLAEWGIRGDTLQDHTRVLPDKRSQITQYNESDGDFIARLLERNGIHYTFVHPGNDPAAPDILVLADDATRAPQRATPLSVRSETGQPGPSAAVTALHHAVRHTIRHTHSRDYNRLDPAQRLIAHHQDQAHTTQPQRTGQASTKPVYTFAPHTNSQSEADRQTRLAALRLAHQSGALQADSSVADLSPGLIVHLDPADVAASLATPAGWRILQLTHHYTRDTGVYRNHFTCSPADLPYVPPLTTPIPRIQGSTVGHIVGDAGGYADIDEHGYYLVRLRFDLDEHGIYECSKRMPLQKFNTGHQRGFHSPLLPGLECTIQFDHGDLDRPYIAGVRHNAKDLDVVAAKNRTRHVWRTDSDNKLRMEDQKGYEHLKWSTPYASTQLNMGHLVDAQGKPRGTGFELRTDQHGVLRGAKGVFLSADGQSASGPQLQMRETIGRFEAALGRARELARAVHAAASKEADLDAQAQQIENNFSALKQPAVLVGSPAGIGLASSQSIQLAAEESFALNAAGHADLSIWKRFTVAAGELVSLFAHRLGMRLIAAQGKVEVHAQSDAMDLIAVKALNIKSTEDEIRIEARKRIVLATESGEFIRLENGLVNIGAPGKLKLEIAALEKSGPASASVDLPSFSTVVCKECLRNALRQGAPMVPLL